MPQGHGPGQPNLPTYAAPSTQVRPAPATHKKVGNLWYYQDPVTHAWMLNPGQNTTPSYADPITGQASQPSADQRLIYGQTARNLNLLRSTVGQGQQSGIQRLRQQLASRGLMDSGSLGAGTSSIVNRGQGLLAQGTQYAANQEADKILGLNQEERQHQWGMESEQRQVERQRALLELQMRLQRENQPTGMEQFLGGAGGGVGAALPFFLMRGAMGGV